MARNTPRKAVKTTGRGFHSDVKDGELEKNAETVKQVGRRITYAAATDIARLKKERKDSR